MIAIRIPAVRLICAMLALLPSAPHLSNAQPRIGQASADPPVSAHFISDDAYRRMVGQRFAERRPLLEKRGTAVLPVFAQPLRTAEREAMEFLYAFMPLSDIADMDASFFLRAVRASFEARDLFPWGRAVPERIFRHFVLPVRVNNEHLDSARGVFLRELAPRLRGLDMYAAVIEINHWCRAQATYRGSDARTSAPLATVRTGLGRCGEETTLAVAALRAAGIPARQCYTPRWAHSDDNHAWVEAWVDGVWHYLGACEPEPVLDRAWFTEPVRRAMLVATTVFGPYEGDEPVIRRTPFATRINLLPHYAPPREIAVQARDAAGAPVPGAEVTYCLYNYAEFFPLIIDSADAKGVSRQILGRGDFLVRARHGALSGETFVSDPAARSVDVRLAAQPVTAVVEEVDIMPPAERPGMPGIDDIAAHEARCHIDDSVRASREVFFLDSADAAELAGRLALDTAEVTRVLETARGNGREIARFLEGVPADERRPALCLLGTLTEKDLRDATAAALRDHLASGTQTVATDLSTTPAPGILEFLARSAREHAQEESAMPSMAEDAKSTRENQESEVPNGCGGDGFLTRTVLSPRIGRELITAWRSPLAAHFRLPPWSSRAWEARDAVLWVRDSVAIDSASNWAGVPLSPAGVLELRQADRVSRDIFFVALCRTVRIPARLDPATGAPQTFDGRLRSWRTVAWDPARPAPAEARLTLRLADTSAHRLYSAHFTLSRIENGTRHLLDYEGDSVFARFPATVTIASGYYELVTGARHPDGSVLARVERFPLAPGADDTVAIVMREEVLPPVALGTCDRTSRVYADERGRRVTLDSLPGLTVMLWLEQGTEPTRHVLADLSSPASSPTSAGLRTLAFDARGASAAMARKRYEGSLPPDAGFGGDGAPLLLAMRAACGKSGAPAFPVVLLTDAEGRVYFHSEGYVIGIGEKLLRLAARLRTPASGR